MTTDTVRTNGNEMLPVCHAQAIAESVSAIVQRAFNERSQMRLKRVRVDAVLRWENVTDRVIKKAVVNVSVRTTCEQFGNHKILL